MINKTITINEETINIAYCTDENYLEYVATSIKSIILNSSSKLSFYVFVYNVTDSEIFKLKSTSKLIQVIEMDKLEVDKYHNNFTIKHLNRSTYMRLAVPRLLSGKVDKFIYLDADTLCFSDLGDINKVDINNVVCAASHDALTKNDNKNAKRLGIESGHYFNAGFLYINVANWVKSEVEIKANKILLDDGKTLPYLDQDALNIVLNGHIKFIDNKWNFIYNWYTEKQKESFFYDKVTLPKIVHFTGGRKPWFVEHDGLAQQLFIFYHHFTPWKNNPLRSYKEKMRPTDYRVYSRKNWRNKKYLTSVTWYLKYLRSRFK
ncbi:glycosyltransferase family 8 protein [Enterobacteriaceae bacterium YMB-R22]|uniref:glycosyltransferase family 8 protein n=1 Tax=Tenebrionicola larvae TaxID=2815733 RepID=UPI0020131C89|nr:glycosyltransferase [Tenebrionicola larvae]MBV4414256.1 glycosyltransferase family 8 protein [Tenebrionicola larvae]